MEAGRRRCRRRSVSSSAPACDPPRRGPVPASKIRERRSSRPDESSGSRRSSRAPDGGGRGRRATPVQSVQAQRRGSRPSSTCPLARVRSSPGSNAHTDGGHELEVDAQHAERLGVSAASDWRSSRAGFCGEVSRRRCDPSEKRRPEPVADLCRGAQARVERVAGKARPCQRSRESRRVRRRVSARLYLRAPSAGRRSTAFAVCSASMVRSCCSLSISPEGVRRALKTRSA